MSSGPHVVLIGASGWLGRDLVNRLPNQVSIPASEVLGGSLAYLGSVTRNPQVIVNAAGYMGDDAQLTMDVNFRLVQELVHYAEVSGARILQLGSAAEYGASQGARMLREDTPEAPTSAYGEAKLRATMAVRESGLGAVLRIFNVAAGPPKPGSPLEDVVRRVSHAEVSGFAELLSAETRRDWISKEFVLRVILSAVNRPVTGVFNVCSGRATSMREIADHLLLRVGIDAEVRDLQLSEPSVVLGDPERLKMQAGLFECLDASQLARVVIPHIGDSRTDISAVKKGSQ